MADIVYTYENSVYLNITNACPCRCKFCIRNNGDAVGEAHSLWFEKHSPAFAEIKAALDAFDFSDYTGEIIFCGYGEPTCAYDNLIQACRYIKENLGLKIRLNTNGLSDLLNKKPTAAEICRYADTVSVSLNEYNSEKYEALCAPVFGAQAFDAVLAFARDCKANGANVKFSCVDVIPQADIAQCRALADSMGIPLRVRAYTAD